MTDTPLDFKRLHKGDCPKCMGSLKGGSPEMIVCTLCTFKISREKFFKRVKKTSMGYWKVLHRTRTEDEQMLDLSQL